MQKTEHVFFWAGNASAIIWALFQKISLICKVLMPILSVISIIIYIAKMVYDWRKKHNNKSNNSEQ